ncbi:hypothetical protein YC2023_016311 [Brassica napus]
MLMEYANNILYVINRQIHIQFASRSLGSSAHLPLEITAQPLVIKQKNRSHFYEYSPSKSSESSEMLEVVWTTEV